VEKEIYYFIRRLENAILNACTMRGKISNEAEPAFQEGINSLNEARHHFETAKIAET